MGKEKYNKEELIRLLIHEGKSYKEVAAMRGDGSTGEAIRKAANRYGIKVSDRKKPQNSFISPNGNGYVTKSYFTKRRPKGKKVEFVGDLFGNPNQLQKPKVINSSSSNKGGNSSISSLDAKRMNLKRYNSHKTRSLEVTPTAPGQNEWVKRVKTNGQARWENNGLYIPGFEKL